MNESSPTSVLHQIIQTLGFQDFSSFALSLIFLIAACAFIISGIFFLIKKRQERREALERIVKEAQEIQPKAESPKKEPVQEVVIKPKAPELPKAKPAQEVAIKPKAPELPKAKPAQEVAIKPKAPELPKAKPVQKVVIKPKAPELPKAEPVQEVVIKPKAPELPKAEPVQEVFKPKAAPVQEIPAKPEHVLEQKKSLGAALKNTRGGFIDKIAKLFSRGHEISDDEFEELEAILFTADIGAKTAQKLLDNLKARVKTEKIGDKEHIRKALKEEMLRIFQSVEPKINKNEEGPRVFMFVGVNGAGKTTSIAKLGAHFAQEGKRVVFGAGDTFRAAAVQQLTIWGDRAGIAVVSGKEGSDSAATLFDAVAIGKRDNADIVLCDTAGRLHTKVELMDELKKVYRVLSKAQAGAPHEVFLVIDATMGQNAITQAREFAQATPLTGVVLSKLDGTAKGGVALGIVDELKVPICYIGIGEQLSDMREFNALMFVDALFEDI